MKTTRHKTSSVVTPSRRSRLLTELRGRLAEAEETLRAIRSGEVDTVTGSGEKASQVFTLEGEEHAYRVLIESMHEGALTLTENAVILYANRRFAEMVGKPLEQVIGSSLRRFLSPEDSATLAALTKQADIGGSKVQVILRTNNGPQLPAQISISSLAKNKSNRATTIMVVTDLTDARRTELQLRILTHRVVEAQEAERGRVAVELHDNITQLLCAIIIRSQALTDKLQGRDRQAEKEAVKLREMLGRAANEVERISSNLRPSILSELGLAAVLRDTGTKFAERTGISVKLSCEEAAARLSAVAELTLYRILQEALTNVEKHSRARHVTIQLIEHGNFIQLTITDDGIGFNQNRIPAGRKGAARVGLLSMRERASYVGGALIVKSAPGSGTEIMAQIPSLQAQNRAGKGTTYETNNSTAG